MSKDSDFSGRSRSHWLQNSSRCLETLPVILVVGAALFWSNLNWSVNGVAASLAQQRKEHGWPFTWLRRPVIDSPFFPSWDAVMEATGRYSPPPRRRWPWEIPNTPGAKFTVKPIGLFLDLLTAGCILAASAYCVHRWRRLHSKRLQFSLRTLLLLPVVVAVLFGIGQSIPGLTDTWVHVVDALVVVILIFGIGCTLWMAGRICFTLMPGGKQ